MSICRLRSTYTTLTIIREGVYQVYYKKTHTKPTIIEKTYTKPTIIEKMYTKPTINWSRRIPAYIRLYANL